MLVQRYRPFVWRVQGGPAAYNRKRGDLIGVVQDLESDFAHGFFVRDVPSTTTITLDREVPIQSGAFLENSPDLSAEDDIFPLGVSSSIHIVTKTETVERTITAISGATITVDTPLASTDIIGARCAVAPREALFRRLLVMRVERSGEQKAVLHCVDEAPEIETELQRRFG